MREYFPFTPLDAPPNRELSEAVDVAMKALGGLTIETLRAVAGVSPEAYEAMAEGERRAMWTPARLLILARYFRQQADGCEQTARNIRGAATALLEEALLPRMVEERASARPIVLCSHHPPLSN